MKRRDESVWQAIVGILGGRRHHGVRLSQLVELSGADETRALHVVSAMLAAGALTLTEGGDPFLRLARGYATAGKDDEGRPTPSPLEEAQADDHWTGRRAPRERGQAAPPYPPRWELLVDPAAEAERRDGDRLPVQVWSDASPWAELGQGAGPGNPTHVDGRCRCCHGHSGGVCLMCLPTRRPTAKESAIEASRQAGVGPAAPAGKKASKKVAA